MTTETATMKQDVLDRMQHLLNGGGDLSEASAAVLNDIIREGHTEAFARELGQAIIEEVWRLNNRRERQQARAGPRRVDTEALQDEHSLLSSLHRVGDQYVQLGDMTKDMCRDVQSFYSKQATSALKEAYMFSRVADNLKAGEVVRSKFTDDQLRSLLEQFVIE